MLCRKLRYTKKYVRNYFYGYKSAGNYIIKLDVGQCDNKNNLERKVDDKNYAIYRTNKAYPVKIYNKRNGLEIDNIRSDYNSNFIYSLYRFATIDNYDDNNKPYGKGIYFYLSEEAAYYHNLDTESNYTGTYKQWYPDGNLFLKINYVKGKKRGKYEVYFPNGTLGYQCNYVNGMITY